MPIPAAATLTANEKDETKTASITQPACDESHAAACVALGIALQSGRGMAKDVVRARVAYQKGCDGGDISGCRRLGVLVMTGDGGEKNDDAAPSCFNGPAMAMPSRARWACHSRRRRRKERCARSSVWRLQRRISWAANMGRAYATGRAYGRYLQKAFAAFKHACDGNLAAGRRTARIASAVCAGGRRQAAKAFRRHVMVAGARHKILDHIKQTRCRKDTRAAASPYAPKILRGGNPASPARLVWPPIPRPPRHTAPRDGRPTAATAM